MILDNPVYKNIGDGPFYVYIVYISNRGYNPFTKWDAPPSNHRNRVWLFGLTSPFGDQRK